MIWNGTKNISEVVVTGGVMDHLFFNIAATAIENEEKELNVLFDRNKQLYARNHYGVCNLYETTFVYLIFKELLKAGYQYSVYWEYPYPSNNIEKCDLALLNTEGKPEALIEFKIWIRNDDKEIKSDINKLKRVEGCRKYIFVIGYGGDIDENDRYLSKHNNIHLIEKKPLLTKYYLNKTGRLEDANLNLFMYEV